MNILAVSVYLTAVAVATTSAAQPASSVSPLSPIYACAEKTDPTQRLACFDAAVATVKAAESRSEIIALDQPRVAAVRREAFGFRIPSLPRLSFGGPKPNADDGQTPAATAQQADNDVDQQTFAVARVGSSGGKVALYFENGNVWHLIENDVFNAPRQTPFNVRIRSASMGSFILQVEGRNKGYRVRRIE